MNTPLRIGASTAAQLHPQAAQMATLLERQQVTALRHMTQVANLPFIAQAGGLRSKAFLRQHNLHKKVKSNGDFDTLVLDHLNGNWDKVRLVWCELHPMFFRLDHQELRALIEIDLLVALSQDAVFSDRNSHDAEALRASGLAGLQAVDFSAVRHSYPCPTERIKRYKQAEVLLPEVPSNAFRQIIFWTAESFRRAKQLCQDAPDFCRLFKLDLFYLQRGLRGHDSCPAQLPLF